MRTLLPVALLLSLALPIPEALAQPVTPAAEGGTPAIVVPPPGDGTSFNLDPPKDGYTYNPQGRRDPFENMLKKQNPEKGPRPQGIAGFIINEVALKGIVDMMDPAQGHIALLVAPTGATYFCKVGQRLYDGTITAIDAATVTFRQEVTDPLSKEKTRDVKKTLYPSEEAR
jgi:Tfp pilus assembly protein PilP